MFASERLPSHQYINMFHPAENSCLCVCVCLCGVSVCMYIFVYLFYVLYKKCTRIYVHMYVVDARKPLRMGRLAARDDALFGTQCCKLDFRVFQTKLTPVNNRQSKIEYL